jgi:5-methylcytosine-specific restriction protein A
MAYQDYNKNRRDPQVTAWLHSRRYRVARAAFLAEYPLCRLCEKEDRAVGATILSHVKAHNGDYDMFWDPTNWEGLCVSCHATVSAKCDGGYGNAKKEREE